MNLRNTKRALLAIVALAAMICSVLAPATTASAQRSNDDRRAPSDKREQVTACVPTEPTEREGDRRGTTPCKPTSPPAHPCSGPGLAITDGTFFDANTVLTSAPECMGVVDVNTDSGPGSLRAVVALMNDKPEIEHLLIAPGLSITVNSAIHFSGPQPLRIQGNSATLNGNGPAALTWDQGLLYTTASTEIEIDQLGITNSFTNGLAFFMPAGAAPASVSLHSTYVLSSRFHGLLVDGQATDSYSTLDQVHAACVDPHPVDRLGGVTVQLTGLVLFISNGAPSSSYDDSLATGCPRDFDGIRIDEGGPGSLDFSMSGGGGISESLSDGIELDERGAGSLTASIVPLTNGGFSVSNNGLNGATVDGLYDPDDGIDLDETGPGDVTLVMSDVSVSGNAAEGLDLDEEGEGSVTVTDTGSEFVYNKNEGLKLREAGDGSVTATLTNTTATQNDTDGLDIEETDAGNVWVSAVSSTINDNGELDENNVPTGRGIKVNEAGLGSVTVDLGQSTTVNASAEDGVKIGESDDGDLSFVAANSSIRHNDDEGAVFEESGPGSLTVDVDNSTVSQNDGDAFRLIESGDGDLNASVDGSTIKENDGFAVSATQYAPGFGTLLPIGNVLQANSGGAYSLAGALLVPLGDVDCSGAVDIDDAAIIGEYVPWFGTGTRVASQTCPLQSPATEIFLPSADVNQNGVVDFADAIATGICVPGFETSYIECALD